MYLPRTKQYPMVGEAMPMQALSRYYPRLADAKLSLRLTARELLSTEARLSAMQMVHTLTLCHRSDDENHTLQKRHNLKELCLFYNNDFPLIIQYNSLMNLTTQFKLANFSIGYLILKQLYSIVGFHLLD